MVEKVKTAKAKRAKGTKAATGNAKASSARPEGSDGSLPIVDTKDAPKVAKKTGRPKGTKRPSKVGVLEHTVAFRVDATTLAKLGKSPAITVRALVLKALAEKE